MTSRDDITLEAVRDVRWFAALVAAVGALMLALMWDAATEAKSAAAGRACIQTNPDRVWCDTHPAAFVPPKP